MARTTTIQTERYRRVTVEKLGSGSPRLGIADTLQGTEKLALLTPKEARQLIDALEPMAAPPRTALDVFKDFPLGQVFAWTDKERRVKVSATHYAIVRNLTGRPSIYEAAEHLTDKPADAIKAVSL